MQDEFIWLRRNLAAVLRYLLVAGRGAVENGAIPGLDLGDLASRARKAVKILA